MNQIDLSHFCGVFHNLPYLYSIGMLVVLLVGLFLFFIILNGKQRVIWFARLVLLEYLFLLIALAVLTRSVMQDRTFYGTPFWSYRAIMDGRDKLLIENIENVIAFVPLGLLLGCCFNQIRWWKALLIGGGFSFLIEVSQFAFKRGYAEFDDVFHNTLGCLIGYGIYVGLKWLVKKCHGKTRSESHQPLID